MTTETALPLAPNVADKKEIQFVPFGADEQIKLNVAIITKLVAINTKKGHGPSETDCIRFMMLCRARKLNPFEGDCFLQGYDGQDGPVFSLITAHQAFLKRAEVNAEYDGMVSGVIVLDESGQMQNRVGDFTHKGDELLGGWAVVHFKTRKFPTERRLKLQTFNKGYGRWKDDAAGMIVKCAEADALRSSFPTMLGGLYSAEESHQVIDVGPGVKSPDFAGPGAPVKALEAPKAPPAPKTVTPPTPAAAKAPEPAKAPVTPPAAAQPAPTPPAPPQPVAAAEPQPAAAPEPPAVPVSSAPVDEVAAKALKDLLELMKTAGATEDKVIAFCVSKKICKPEQKKLSDLSSAKLTNLVKAWPNIKDQIK